VKCQSHGLSETSLTSLLEALVKEQEGFNYTVSHDLRPLLRHINSFSAILSEEVGSDTPSNAMIICSASVVPVRKWVG